jgi:hypothetical protein
MTADVLTSDYNSFHRFVMGFLKRFRSKPQSKENHENSNGNNGHYINVVTNGYHVDNAKLEGQGTLYYYPSPPVGRDLSEKFDDRIIRLIIAELCPHSQDKTYQSHEEVDLPDTCMLCDMRDLANFVLARRAWRGQAQQAL